VTQERRVTVHAGDNLIVDFTRPAQQQPISGTGQAVSTTR
jgi:hypothetical protein